MNRQRRVISYFFILVLCWMVAGVANAQTNNLQNVRVGYYLMPGYHNLSPDGVKSGYGYDFLQLLRRYSHLNFDYVGTDKSWPELLEMLRNGEIDLLTGSTKTAERERDYDFTSPIGNTSVNLYVRKVDSRFVKDNYATYQGMRIGIVKQEVHLEKFLKALASDKHFEYKSVYFDNYYDMIDALESKQIDGICGITFRQIPRVRVLETFKITKVYGLVKKGNKKLLDAVNEAILQLDQSIYMWPERIYHANYLQDSHTDIDLLDSEKEYVLQHSTPGHKVKVAVDNDFKPFSWCENGEYKGIVVDLLDSMMKMVGLEYEFVNAETNDDMALDQTDADIYLEFSGASYDAEKKGLVTSPVFLNTSVSLVSSMKLEQIKRLGVCRKTPYLNKRVAEIYKKDEIVYDTPEELYAAVKSGNVDGAFFYSYVAQNFFNNEHDNDLQVTVMPGMNIPLYMVTRANDSRELITILSKCLVKLRSSEINAVTTKYLAAAEREVSIIEFVRSHMALTLSLLFGLIILFALQRYRQLKELQRKDAKTRKIAEEANAAKTSFLFNMSHDIRTPMNAIIGFTNLLRKHQEVPQKRNDYIDKIEKSSGVLLSLINNVLEMARIEKGTIEFDEVPVHSGDFNDSLYVIFNEMMKHKGLKFICTADVQHSTVYADVTKLREILYNLLSNAYKYTEKGSVSMELKEVPSKRAGYAFYQTTITDTGIGMSEEFLPHLFDEFSRESHCTTNIEGTGLGMPIVKRLVDLMGGTIEVKSQKGVGTTFILTLPHKIAEDIEIQKEKVEDAPIENFEGKRILLAEDNDLNAEIAMEILGEVGFLIERAEDGKRCVEMIEQADSGYYDVILMDIQMPNMNGYEATRAIRELSDKSKADTPILAMTANAFEEDKRMALRNGMNGHLAKPIDVVELLHTLKKVLKKKH